MIGLYQLLFGLFAISVCGVLIGFKMAIHIHNPVLYILFWAMYFITFLCFLALVFNFYSYNSIKYKTAKKGEKGDRGNDGEIGDDGVCASNCRDDMYYIELIKFSEDHLNKLERETHKNRGYGVLKPIVISNKYWKDRMSFMTRSKQFSDLLTTQGRDKSMDYIKSIIKVWLDLLYKETGRTYFETLGAENELEWKDTNPWNEIKKYDIYYWGMSDNFKIKQIKKCRPKIPQDTKPRLIAVKTNNYDLIWYDKHNLGRSDSHASYWKPRKLNYNGTDVYPVGSIFVNQRPNDARFRSDKHVRDHIEFDGHYDNGPIEKTILVGGDSVAKPVSYTRIGDNSYKYCANWVCRSSNYKLGKRRRSHVHYYRLNPPPGYTCLGDVAIQWGVPNLDDYRCVKTDCLKKIGGGLKQKFHPQEGNMTAWKNNGNAQQQEDANNLFYVYSRWGDQRRNLTQQEKDGIMGIRDECLTVEEVPETIDPVYNKGWYPPPDKRDKKYSVMNYLEIPSEAILVNSGNPKLFLKIQHMSKDRFNAYNIIQYNQDSKGKKVDQKLEAVTTKVLKWRKYVADPNADTFMWTVNMDETKTGEMTILSDAHNKYLRFVDYNNVSLVDHNKLDKYGYWKIHA